MHLGELGDLKSQWDKMSQEHSGNDKTWRVKDVWNWQMDLIYVVDS